jgi:hypothetical protein
VGLERGPLSLLSTIEELFGRESRGSSLENRNTAVGTRRADHTTSLYLQKLTLTSPTSGGRSVVVVRSRIKATEFVLFFLVMGEHLRVPAHPRNIHSRRHGNSKFTRDCLQATSVALSNLPRFFQTLAHTRSIAKYRGVFRSDHSSVLQ